jgi:NAD(P)-dependent dehydrogenase (short-subunit alcohol dehydrogenase family)
MGKKPLAGRVAAITGAAGALGLAISRRLAEDGAGLVLLDLSAALLDRAAASLSGTGADILCIEGDLGCENAVQTAVVRVTEKFGRCDILVNNVGILPKAVSFENFPTELWDLTLTVNLKSAFLCTRGFGSLMLAQRKGSIVSIGSSAASFPNSSAPYGVSKAALLALSRQVAMEWGPRGVRSNAVSPGLIRTPLSEPFYANDATRNLRETAVASRRIGTTEEIAGVVTFLAGDDSSYINGQEIVVDGGLSRTALIMLQPEREAYAACRSWPD